MEYGLAFISKGSILNKEDIRNGENRMKAKLPVELEQLLLIHNGGDLEVNSFSRLLSTTDFEESAVERIVSLEEIETILDNLQDDEEFISSEIVPFANLLGPGLVGIGIGEKNNHKIYVYDWDFGLTYQAASLKEFCKQLKFEDASDLRKEMLNKSAEDKWLI